MNINWSFVKVILMLAVIAILLVVAFRSCKGLTIKQKSTDTKSTLSLEMEKTKHKEPEKNTQETNE